MSIKKQAQRFWKTFESERKNLELALVNNNVEESEEIKKILNTYFEELCNCSLDIEEEDGIFEITFLPEQEKNAQLICALLKNLTPEKIKKTWIVHSSLPALSKKALNTVLRLQDKDYGAEEFVVYYEVDQNNKCFNVEIYCEAFKDMEENKAMEIAVYMLQLYVGEVALEAYINGIEITCEQRSSEACILSDFYETVLEIVVEEKWSEYEDATSIFRVFKLEEEIVSDEVRKDMKIIFTVHPLLIQESIQSNPFIANQFFDLGGEYGYLYFEHARSEVNDALIRQKLDKRLNELLYPKGIAKSIGGAIGLKYSYIDLAIFDKEEFIKALAIINEKLSIKLKYQAFE